MKHPLLKILGMSLLMGTSAHAFSQPNSDQQTHAYCEPNQPCWPNKKAWTTLKKQVGGRLVVPKDIIAACKKTPQSPTCKQELQLATNPFYLQTTPDGSESQGYWKAWTYHNSNYAVAAKNPQDIQAAVNFARQYHLRLVIKGAGHDFLGRSNAKNSLLIWTHNLQQLHYNPSNQTITVGAGVDWLQAYQKAAKYGRFVLGGGCNTVGAVGGFTLGGGFGPFSKQFGTGAANLVQAKVVLADGQYVTANDHNQYKDLFTALRGGGPGFGVVTQMTYRTYPLPHYFGAAVIEITADSDQADKQLIQHLLAFLPGHILNSHWGDEIAFLGKNINPATKGKNAIIVAMSSQGLDAKSEKAIWTPFVSWMKRQHHYTILGESYSQTPANKNWDTAWQEKNNPKSIVVNKYPGVPKNMFWLSGNGDDVHTYFSNFQSWWLPMKLFKKPDSRKNLSDAIFTAEQSIAFPIYFNKGLAGGSKNALKLTHQTMMNPAVTKAAGLVTTVSRNGDIDPGVPGHTPQSHSDELNQSAEQVEAAMAPFKRLPLARHAGSYINETAYSNPNWSTDFWGAKNYKVLQAIKDKYDPTGLFSCHHCVVGTGGKS